MKVLFMSLTEIEDIDSQGIYTDLLKTFRDHGHEVVALAPRERRTGLPTELVELQGIQVLRIAVGNITKCGLIEKGISNLTIKSKFLKAMKHNIKNTKFDLVLYTTPPTTIYGLVETVKRAVGAKAYLLLKDIFPQNSLDLGMLSKNGVKGLIYRYFKHTERKTYAAADWIGCMSRANRDYLIANEPEIDPDCIEVNPNSLIPRDMSHIDESSFKERYGLPCNERIFVYGGSLGRPQGIDFLIEVLRLNECNPVGYFLIAGNGTERAKLESYFSSANPKHAQLLPNLPRTEFDAMLIACNVGLVFLDHRFTIPNFPSRLLSYMQASLPIVAATDQASDMGRLAEENGFGIWAESTDAEAFLAKCRELTDASISEMGARAHAYMVENYTSEKSYEIIMEHFDGK